MTASNGYHPLWMVFTLWKRGKWYNCQIQNREQKQDHLEKGREEWLKLPFLLVTFKIHKDPYISFFVLQLMYFQVKSKNKVRRQTMDGVLL